MRRFCAQMKKPDRKGEETMSDKSIMTYETVALDEAEGALVILDQT